jgi:hypothetical protein
MIVKHKSTEITKTYSFDFDESELKKIQLQIHQLYNEIVGQDDFIKKCPDVWDFGVEISTVLDNE